VRSVRCNDRAELCVGDASTSVSASH
jgi:hypothetical protein